MSEHSAQLFASFTALPPAEQHALFVEMLRHLGELPESCLSDDQLALLADTLFQQLDLEESDAEQSTTR